MSKFKVGDKVRKKSGQPWGQGGTCDPFAYVTVSQVDGVKIWARETGTFMPEDSLELVEEREKWHPHHDLIIEWLENEDAIVQGYLGREWQTLKSQPQWCTKTDYQIIYPDLEKQSKIEQIEKEMRELADRLKELKDE